MAQRLPVLLLCTASAATACGSSGSGSSTTSGSDTSTLVAVPSIATQPASLTVNADAAASFTVSATGGDLLFGATGNGNIDGTCRRAYSSVTTHGILYPTLSSNDQALIQAAIRAYVNIQTTEHANDLLDAYLSSDALAQTYTAYAGSGTVTTNGNYFRIDGPRLWIEFSVQRGVIFSNDIHYHTIWRDKFGDYGGKCVG